MNNNLPTWIMIGIQLFTILAGVLIYIITLPTKAEIHHEFTLLRADIKELNDRLGRLEQNHLEHLTAHHIPKSD